MFSILYILINLILPFLTISKTNLDLILLSSFYNEEFLLPYWIKHHAKLFDYAVLIDYNSTDSSLDIIRELAPTNWIVLKTNTSQFTSRDSDAEFMRIESNYPDRWKIVLTIGEFLVVTRDKLHYMINKDINVIRFPSFQMIDINDNNTKLDSNIALIEQRHHYYIDPRHPKEWFGINRYARFLHRHINTNIGYGSGRHHLEDLNTREILSVNRFDRYDIKFEIATDGFIAKFKWAPWPQSIDRMLNINAKYSIADKEIQYNPSGELIFSHQYNSSIQLNEERNRILNSNYIFSLKDLVIINNKVMQDFNIDNYTDIEDIDHKYNIISSIHKQYLAITNSHPFICNNYSCFYRNTKLSEISDDFLQPIKIMDWNGNYKDVFIRVNFLLLLENDYNNRILRQSNNLLNDDEYIIHEYLLQYYIDFCEVVYGIVDRNDENFQTCVGILNRYVNSYIIESKEI